MGRAEGARLSIRSAIDKQCNGGLVLGAVRVVRVAKSRSCVGLDPWPLFLLSFSSLCVLCVEVNPEMGRCGLSGSLG